MLIIFDCDGVLVDSEILSARVDAEILGEYGFEITPEDLAHRYAGLTTDRVFQLAGEAIGRTIPEAALHRAEAETDKLLKTDLVAIAGVHEMLDQLDGPRCICSNSRSERLRLTLDLTKLWDRFRPYVFSARDIGDGRGKPAPDVFLHAARMLESNPAEAIVIEDSVAGVTGAVAAGMRVIGFTGASHSYPGHGESLMDAGATTVVRRMADVPPTIEALRQWRTEPV